MVRCAQKPFRRVRGQQKNKNYKTTVADYTLLGVGLITFNCKCFWVLILVYLVHVVYTIHEINTLQHIRESFR